MKALKIASASLALTLLATSASAATWPSVTGQNIGTGLSGSFEPSGIIYSSYYNSLFVVHDEGQYVKMDTNGNIASGFPKNISGDLEAITVTSSYSPNVYIGLETPNKIQQVNASTGTPGYSWNLSTWMTSSDPKQGLEALAYVPESAIPDSFTADSVTQDGLFYAGLQETGDIYIFDINRSVDGAGAISYRKTILNPTSYTDLADLYYDSVSGNLFALYDSADKIVEMSTSGTVLSTRVVPGTDQEGLYLAYSGSSIIYYIAQDTGGVIKYSDVDNDGTATNADCNDADATISSNRTYYQDYDNDGLGNAAVSQSVCSLSAPSGYVTNSSDTDDSGVVVVPPVETEPTPDPVETTPEETTYSPIEYLNNGIDDDGDGVVDEWNTLANNGAHPTYGSYNANSTTLYSQIVTSIAGASNGAIKVKFADGSGYRYSVFSKGNTTVTSKNGTAYLLVRSGKKYALVNAYTGAVADTIRSLSGVRVRLKTLSLHRR